MTKFVPQYFSIKIKPVVSDSMLRVFVSVFITSKYRGFFARQMCSFMNTFTFLVETQFRDAIQSADSNNLSIERKSKLRGKL